MHVHFFLFESEFSKRLTSAMESRGINLFALAVLTGVSPSTVKRWLDGKFEPRHKNLARLANTLDVTSDYVLGRT